MPTSLDIFITFLWMGASVAAILFGLVAEFRLGKMGWFLVVAGLSLLAVSTFKLHPALTLAGLGSEVPKLREDNAFQAREIAHLQREERSTHALYDKAIAENTGLKSTSQALGSKLDATRAELETIQTQRTHIQRQLDELTRDADKQKQQADSTIAALRSELEAAETQRTNVQNQLDALTRSATKQKEHADTQIMTLVSELDGLKVQHTQLQNRLDEANFSLGKKAESGDLPAIASRPLYSIERIATSELVQGSVGTYYLIRIRDPVSGRPLQFPLSLYKLPSDSSVAWDAVKELRENILEPLARRAPVTLFIRGKASDVPFRKPKRLPTGDEDYRQIQYLPKFKNAQLYKSASATQTVSGEFTNAELPLLRAFFIYELIYKPQSPFEILLLEGEISVDPDFDFILYRPD